MKTTILLIFTLISLNLLAQNYQQQQRTVACYNVLLGGAISAGGSAIHKHKNETTGHALVNGFWKGCVGGLVNYSSKDFARNIKTNLSFGWGSTLMHAAGSSMIKNGVMNEGIFSSWNLEYGFLNLSYQDSKVKCQIKPVALGGFIYSATQSKFDIATSLQLGKVYFVNNTNECVTHINTIVMSEKLFQTTTRSKGEIITHEFIHTLQEEEYCTINYLYKQPKGIFMIDIPFSDIAYHTNNLFPQRYYNSNFFEFEANHFAQGINLSR